MQTGRVLQDSMMMRYCHTPQSCLMSKQMHVSGGDWDSHQQRRLLEDGTRDYRVLVALDGEATGSFLQEITELMVSPGTVGLLPLQLHSDRVLLFKMLARSGATAFQQVKQMHERWPYKTFDIIRSPARAEELKACPECMLDEWTLHFRKFYGDQVGGEVAIQELLAIAGSLHTDTISTERLHSVNQRRAMHKGWGKLHSLDELSAWFLANANRRIIMDLPQPETGMTFSHHKPGTSQPAPARQQASATVGTKGKDHGAKVASQRRKRPHSHLRGGGGGPWRAFLHVNVVASAATFSHESSEAYSALLHSSSVLLIFVPACDPSQ